MADKLLKLASNNTGRRFLGVFSGTCNYLGWNVGLVRLIYIICLIVPLFSVIGGIITVVGPIPAYFIVWLVMLGTVGADPE